MDYDHPNRTRRNWRWPYCVALIIVGALGLLWSLSKVVSFLTVRLQATSRHGVVIGYELAGGRERLRVQASQSSGPGTFMLLDPMGAWPRYSTSQTIELLTWHEPNPYGQRIQRTLAYSPKNYWLKHLIVTVAAFLAAGVGTVGLLQLRAKRPSRVQDPIFRQEAKKR